MEKIYFVIEVPEGFVDKFVGLLKNINITNFTAGEPLVVVKRIYGDEVAATPKGAISENG